MNRLRMLLAFFARVVSPTPTALPCSERPVSGSALSEERSNFPPSQQEQPSAFTKPSRYPLAGLALLCLTASVPSATYATTYYVSNQGNDKSTGTSSSQPWKTIDRVNKQDLNAGDQVLFAGGQTFVGSLSLASEDSGTITSPVVISSYGGGRAW